MGLFFFGTSAAGGAGGGIRKVADAAARTALSPSAGDFAIQIDTNDLWYWNGAAWEVYVEDVDNNDIDTLIAGLANHLSDTVDAHVATAIGFTPAGTIAGTTVQAAVEEVASEAATNLSNHVAAGDPHPGYATDTDLSNHLSDATAAHAASAVSVTPAGDLASTDVQAALVELQGDIDTLEAVSHAAVTLAAFGATPNANGLSLSTQALNMQPADETNPGGVSTAAQVMGGEKRLPGGLNVGSNAALNASSSFSVVSTTKGAINAPAMSTAQRLAIGTPSTGLVVYDTGHKHHLVYNGTLWDPVGHQYINSTATITNATNIAPVDARNQLLPVVGNAAAVTAADIAITTAKNGDRVMLIGTSNTDTVTLVSATNTVMNGSATLAAGDVIEFVHVTNTWYEVSRSL
jgi:hypothetical protein